MAFSELRNRVLVAASAAELEGFEETQFAFEAIARSLMVEVANKVDVTEPVISQSERRQNLIFGIER